MTSMDAGQVKELMRKMARGRTVRHSPGEMNKTEAKYAEQLQLMLLTQQIAWWSFEPIKLRLADRTFYTPDFCILHNDGLIEFVEVKGHWEDDARVKIKVAAETYFMFNFTAVMPAKGGGWKREEF